MLFVFHIGGENKIVLATFFTALVLRYTWYVIGNRWGSRVGYRTNPSLKGVLEDL